MRYNLSLLRLPADVVVSVVPGLPTVTVVPTGTATVGVRTKKSFAFAPPLSERSPPAGLGFP